MGPGPIVWAGSPCCFLRWWGLRWGWPGRWLWVSGFVRESGRMADGAKF